MKKKFLVLLFISSVFSSVANASIICSGFGNDFVCETNYSSSTLTDTFAWGVSGGLRLGPNGIFAIISCFSSGTVSVLVTHADGSSEYMSEFLTCNGGF